MGVKIAWFLFQNKMFKLTKSSHMRTSETAKFNLAGFISLIGVNFNVVSVILLDFSGLRVKYKMNKVLDLISKGGRLVR
jgi:hypothetical protein